MTTTTPTIQTRLAAVAEQFDAYRREAALAATQCANTGDYGGLLANEYERTAWARAAREVRAVLVEDAR